MTGKKSVVLLGWIMINPFSLAFLSGSIAAIALDKSFLDSEGVSVTWALMRKSPLL